MSYRLEIPENCRIHNVFHIYLLKEYHTNERLAKPAPYYDVVNKCIQFHIQTIVGEKLDRKARYFYLVKWTSYDDEIWELEHVIIIADHYYIL